MNLENAFYYIQENIKTFDKKGFKGYVLPIMSMLGDFVIELHYKNKKVQKFYFINAMPENDISFVKFIEKELKNLERALKESV